MLKPKHFPQMNVIKTIFTLLLCIVCTARGDQSGSFVIVCGDVPKPGPIPYEDKGITFDSAMAIAGINLSPFYDQARNGNHRTPCPVQVVIYREDKKTSYNPISDAAVLRALPLERNDAISITDLRQHPQKIHARKQRIERMLNIGSTELGEELFSLATLQQEYEEWIGDANAVSKGLDEHLKAEASRLVNEGKGPKIIELLDLKLGSLRLEGHGPAHPRMKTTTQLIQIFRELVAK